MDEAKDREAGVQRKRRRIQLGERFGGVEVVGINPARFRCSCGQVFRRMPFAVYSSKRPSCGCLRQALTSDRRSSSPNYVLLDPAMVDEGKAAFAKFRVKCRRCEAQFMVSNAQLLSPKVNPKGCRACVAKARRSKIEARGMTTPVEDAPDQQSRGSR